MSDAPPPAKRRRTDSEPSIETLSEPSETLDTLPVRSKIWMLYGDIILQAESTQFRVNRDILSKHSSVFQDLFLLPQPVGEELVEGCPIVQLADSAIDLELLLSAFYDP